jgi:hypothetical protein
MRKFVAALWLGMGVGAVLAAPAGAASIVVPRAGQVGVGVNGSFGSLANSGQLGEEFGSGFGLGVRLRYRMRYERAIGLSFDVAHLDSRVLGFPPGAFGDPTPADSLLTRDVLNMTTTGVDFYQMFGTRSRNVKWLSIGAGLVQVSAKLSDGEIQYPVGGDGTYLSLGGGVERFVYRSWALDLSARYQAIFYGSTINHNLQAAAGLIFYAAY